MIYMDLVIELMRQTQLTPFYDLGNTYSVK